MRNNNLPLYPAIFGMLLFWAVTPVTIAWVRADFSLTFQVWVRYAGSSAALWIAILSKRTLRSSLAIIKTDLKYFLIRLFITSACTISFQLFYTYCFFLVEPALGILLYQSQVLFSLLAGAVFISAERKLLYMPSTIYSIIMAILGAVAVIIFQEQTINFTFNAGVLMALLAAVSWSFVGLTNKVWLAGKLPPIVNVTMVFSLVSLLLTPVAFISGTPVIGTPGAMKWAVLVGSGILGIAGGQGLYYYLLPKLGLITAASVQLLVPLLTGLLSFFLFEERFTLIQIAGGLVLLTGCRMIIRNKSKLTE